MYYEYDFHKCFDRIIGSQYLVRCNSIINYSNETVNIAGKVIPFVKYFPTIKFFHHIITIDTLENDDWFVPCHQLLCNNLIIEPGLYKSENNKSIVNIISQSQQVQTVFI